MLCKFVIFTPPSGRGLVITVFFFTPPSGRGLVIPFFFRVFIFIFGGHLPQTPGFRSAKEILVVSFATQPRAFILSYRNIFYTPPGGGGTTAGSNAPRAFLVFFFFLSWSLGPDLRPVKTILAGIIKFWFV